MTLLDIHEGKRRTQPPLARVSTRPPAPRFLALFETVLENPLLPTLAFGIVFHIVRFGVHLILNGSAAGFLPSAPMQYLAWLPEFLVPYAALLMISSAYRKTSESMHERILEGLERGNEIQKVSIL